MTIDPNKVKIFIRPGHTDMRKATNGLTSIVQEIMDQDPFSESVFIFCNRYRRLLKAVYWDKNGCVSFGYDGYARNVWKKQNFHGPKQARR
jgi:transposase